jgi:hypothetical protein
MIGGVLRLVPAVLLGLLVAGCGTDEVTTRAEAGEPVATVGDVRFSLPTPHRVVVEHRTAGGWADPQVVLEDEARECGDVRAIAAGPVVAATVACDEHYAVDQAPTASVALVSPDGERWERRDLEGEAYARPGLSPAGTHAVWVQGEDLVTWTDDRFGTAPLPQGSPQVVTVDDDGAVVPIGVADAGGQCVVEAQGSVPVAAADALPCEEVGLSLVTPSEVRGDVSGQAGTTFVVRRAGGSAWTLATPPPIATPGLDRYPDDQAGAIWNQVTANTRGDLVAVGSPDRRHITAQRYDPARQRWTPSRTVHDAGAPVCRRSNADSGVLQGATFRLRLVCAGDPVVLRSRTGETWRS